MCILHRVHKNSSVYIFGGDANHATSIDLLGSCLCYRENNGGRSGDGAIGSQGHMLLSAGGIPSSATADNGAGGDPIGETMHVDRHVRKITKKSSGHG